MRRLGLLLLLGALLAACAPGNSPPASPTSPPATNTPIPVIAMIPVTSGSLWISPAVPDDLRQAATAWGMPAASDASQASLHLDVRQNTSQAGAQWIYALVAPFPTVMDGVTADQLHAYWNGTSSDTFASWPMFMSDSTLQAFSEAWGAPKVEIQVKPADQLVGAAWAKLPAWAIVPFESLEPRWKVLTVDGQSPIRKDFDATAYPLQITFAVTPEGGEASANALPATNRDPALLTTLIMTGTTALVREIAYQMEIHGIDYPGTDIGDVLREADILHVSDEVSFDPSCPVPNPDQNRFYCSDPKYIGLFDNVGVDIVELTGNHILDNGVRSFLYTLDLYTQHHISYFGGGANLVDARKVLAVDFHGTHFAFLGCNAGEPPEPFATSISPGANPCDYSLLTSQVRQLRQQGYLPIVTFQYKEGYSPQVMPWQENDFRKMAEAGAVIVSGSQSHVPMEMEFYSGAFIHYGLGNLFFGQMGNLPPGKGLPVQPAERTEFLDRHVFYNDRYISTELLTAMLEDYARPRPMTTDERATFLSTYFGYSGWLPLIPTPAPKETPTLYPLLQFFPLPTHTPGPLPTPRP